MGGWFCVAKEAKEVALQQLQPGQVCGRGSEMQELVGSWRLGCLQESEPLGGPIC